MSHTGTCRQAVSDNPYTANLDLYAPMEVETPYRYIMVSFRVRGSRYSLSSGLDEYQWVANRD